MCTLWSPLKKVQLPVAQRRVEPPVDQFMDERLCFVQLWSLLFLDVSGLLNHRLSEYFCNILLYNVYSTVIFLDLDDFILSD